MNKIREFFQKFDAWRRSRKVRKAVRVAGSVADTTAAGVGFVLRTAAKAVATVLLVLLVTGLLFTCIFAVYVKTCLTEGLDVSLEEVSLSLSSTIWYKDSSGNWQELQKLHGLENRIWVELDNIPQDLQHAAVSIEDKRFYEHKGVDWYRTVAAFVNMFLGMKDNFGGSTITQQLIKNLTEDDDVTVQRKLQEIFRALEFEQKYTKDEIMTWYLNEIYLGEGCYGVGSAARAYFGKEVWELNTAECAALISITNNPSAYNPYIYPENNQRRAHTTLRQMYEQGYLTYEEYEEAVAYELVLDTADEDDNDTAIYSWYVETILEDAVRDLSKARGISEAQAENLICTGGYNIYACVDMRVQSIVDNYYQNLYNLPQPYRRSSQQLRSAIVIVDPRTGDIAGIAGDVGEKKGNLLLNLATEAKRPPGSSFKPLAVYAPAIDTGLVNQNTGINDSPSIRLSGTSWFPRNSGGYSGVISVRSALISSKNTVAAQLLDKIGLATSWDYLTNRFGITSLVPNDGTKSYTDYAYAPLSLGQLSEGITVKEMAQAFTAFVNEGVMSYARSYSMITDQDGNVVLDNSTRQQYVMKANTAANLCSMMQAAVSSGTGTGAYFGSTAVGGKTGTTSDDKDRYFVGFTMYYVAAVWTGYETPERMYFSGNPACQIFRSIMRDVHSGLGYWSFPSYYINSARLKGAVPSVSPSPTPTEPPLCEGEHDLIRASSTATCTTAGVVTYRCSKCSYSENREDLALGHDYVITAEGDANCTAGGTVTKSCSRCGDQISEYMDALGHSWDSGQISVQPGCESSGVKLLTCVRCGTTTTETVGALGHSYQQASRTDATCTAAGSVSYQCSRCQGSYSETLSALGHDFSVKVRGTDATCTAGGSATYKCSRCSETNTTTSGALGHDFSVSVSSTPATCTAGGSVTNQCSRCPETSTTATSALGHSHSLQSSTSGSSCTSAGTDTFVCGVCGDSYTAGNSSYGPHAFDASSATCLNGCGASNPNYVAPVPVDPPPAA